MQSVSVLPMFSPVCDEFALLVASLTRTCDRFDHQHGRRRPVGRAEYRVQRRTLVGRDSDRQLAHEVTFPEHITRFPRTAAASQAAE